MMVLDTQTKRLVDDREAKVVGRGMKYVDYGKVRKSNASSQ
jgi:hypothetical protein